MDAAALLHAIKPHVDAMLAGDPEAHLTKASLRIASGSLIGLEVNSADVWSDVAMVAMRKVAVDELAARNAGLDLRELQLEEREKRVEAMRQARRNVRDARDLLVEALGDWPK